MSSSCTKPENALRVRGRSFTLSNIGRAGKEELLIQLLIRDAGELHGVGRLNELVRKRRQPLAGDGANQKAKEARAVVKGFPCRGPYRAVHREIHPAVCEYHNEMEEPECFSCKKYTVKNEVV